MHNYQEAYMKSSAAENFIYNTVRSGRDLEQYYSVEIPIFRLNTVYQFRIWETEYLSLSILINEGSELLNWIKTGDRLKMRFYSYDPGNPYQDLYSELVYMERQGYGRLRGHYLAGIEIMEEQRDIMASWPYRPMDWHIIPFSMWSTDYAS
jgi:hypothetical protein